MPVTGRGVVTQILGAVAVIVGTIVYALLPVGTANGRTGFFRPWLSMWVVRAIGAVAISLPVPTAEVLAWTVFLMVPFAMHGAIAAVQSLLGGLLARVGGGGSR